MAQATKNTIFDEISPEKSLSCKIFTDPKTNDKGIEIYNVSTKEASLTIPEMVRGLPVISLNLGAKKKSLSSIKELHLPKTISSLSLSSTALPALERVDIEPGGSFASHNQMIFSADYSVLYFIPQGYANQKVRIPNSVLRVEDEVLSSIPFTEIIFENPAVTVGKISNPVGLFFTNKDAIYGKESLLKLLRDTDLLTIPTGIKNIAYGALESYSFTRLKAPFLPTDDDLGNRKEEFHQKLCEFELTDPDYDISLEDLRKYTNLKSVRISQPQSRYETEDGVLYDKRKARLLFYPRKKEDKSFAVKEGTRSIAPLAFEGTQNLVRLTMPNSVTDLGEQSICYCENLESLWLSNEIKVIPDSSYGDDSVGIFSNNEKLTMIHLPEKLQYIGYNCIFNTAISKIFLPEGLLYMGELSLSNRDLQEIALPKSLRMLETGALIYVTQVTAYEGSAKGLIKAINTQSGPKSKAKWHSCWITMLGEKGERKALIYIPDGITNRQIAELLAMAWDASSFHYDYYLEACNLMPAGDDQILMALILLIYGGKEELRPLLKKNAKKAGQLLVKLGNLPFFKGFLDLHILSKPSATALLEECNVREDSGFAAYLMEYRESNIKKRSFSRFDL